MEILIVGADHLGTIDQKLKQFGVTSIQHITGRQTRTNNRIHVPPAVVFVLVLIDYVNHNTMQCIKLSAKNSSVPLVFAKRSWCSIQQQLIGMGYCQRR